jgi:glycosyltransferase involved in cell wall biosynthesis
MIIKDKDIIVVGLQSWDTEIGSNCKNIAIEFAKHNRVLYVNYPLDRITVLRQKNNPQVKARLQNIRSGNENLLQITDTLWNLYPSCIIESANWLPYTNLFRIVNKINNKRFAAEIRKAIKRLGFKDFILFNDSDMFRSFHLQELIQPDLSIYYTRDHLIGFPYWSKHGRKLEPELFAKSDLVVANSTYLANLAIKYNPHCYYVGQGCETEAFNIQNVFHTPFDISGIKSPLIGYIGALFNIRLNLALIEEIAEKRPDWNIVLIGPEDKSFQESVLHQYNNVHFLGLKEPSELPSYLAQFDIAINPQIVNDVTIGNYPRKIDEYLAMGKPVVATETKAMNIFADHVYFANTSEEYIQQIEHALIENSPEKEKDRISFARSHTWENSVEEIYNAMIRVKPGLAFGGKALTTSAI